MDGPDEITDEDIPMPFGFAPATNTASDPNPPVDIAAASVTALREVWESKRPRARALPSFLHFDSFELRRWLDNLVVLDVDRDAEGVRTYHYRSIGRGASVIEGGDHSGLVLHKALPPAHGLFRIRLYDRAIRTRAPVEIHESLEVIQAGTAKWDIVVLPLARNGLRADHLMVLAYTEERSKTEEPA